MMWLTWRQFRLPAVATAALLAAFAVSLAVSGTNLADEYSAQAAACAAQGGDCAETLSRFARNREVLYLGVTAVVLVLPALIGLFWGAPMIARELEAGTHRLVWNQSVTRTRWLAVKLALTGLFAMAVTGLTSLVVGWWAGPLDKAAAMGYPTFQKSAPLLFSVRGVVPIGYAAFAFVLGVTVGMLIRRALPAMAVTLAVFAAVQVAMPALVRPHLREPVTVTSPLSDTALGELGLQPGGVKVGLRSAAPDGDGWALSNQLVGKDGNPVRSELLPISTTSGPCGPPRGEGPEQGMKACLGELDRLGYRQEITYHPGGRYWAFQWTEIGIYLVLALGLAGFCFRRIRRLP